MSQVPFFYLFPYTLKFLTRLTSIGNINGEGQVGGSLVGLLELHNTIHAISYIVVTRRSYGLSAFAKPLI